MTAKRRSCWGTGEQRRGERACTLGIYPGWQGASRGLGDEAVGVVLYWSLVDVVGSESSI